MNKPIAVSLFLLTLILPACASLVPPTPTIVLTSTFTAVPTPRLTPTSTPVPPGETPDALAALAPAGEPALEWEGIPIMPDAIAGEGDPEGYVFTVQATPQQVQDYYQQELEKLGWQFFAEGQGEASLMLIFMNNAAETLSVNIFTRGNESLVLLVK